jgi:hypothetical protein
VTRGLAIRSCRRQIPNLNIQRPVLAAIGTGEYSRPDFRDGDLLAPASMAAVDADVKVQQFGVTIARCFIAVHGPQLRVVQGTVLDVLIDTLLLKKLRSSL